jgi:Zn-dependent protease
MDIVIYIVAIVGIILISMTLHEAMHAFVSYWLGDDTAKLQGRLTLNPIKHIDPFFTVLIPLVLVVVGLPPFGAAKPVPFNPDRVRWDEWGAALIALAGPLTNFVLAFIFFGLGVVLNLPADNFGAVLISLAVQINLGFFIFNLLPIPPLDGSRVIFALAPDFVRKGMMYIERYGIMVVFILVLLGGAFIGPLMGGAIEFFLNVFKGIFRI